MPRALWLIAPWLAVSAWAASCVPAYVLTGEWSFSSLSGHEPGKASYWTNQVGAQAEWRPAFPGPQRARVSLYKVVHTSGNDAKVKIEIAHSGKVETLYLDFSKGPSGWADLGEFDFSGGCEDRVTLAKISPSGNTRAAAVRFDQFSTNSNQVIASFLLDAPTAGPFTVDRIVWDDLRDAPGAAAIEWLSFRGFVEGVSAKEFAPDAAVTQGEFAVWLMRALGRQPHKQGSAVRRPTTPEERSAAAVEAAASGVSKTLNPNAPLSKENLLAMVFAAVKAAPKNRAWLAGPPESATDSAAEDYLRRNGILDEAAEDLSRCSNEVPRRLAALVLKRFVQTFVDAGPPAGSPWRLTFQEEFHGDKLDTDRWSVESGSPGHILSSRWPENVRVANGLLQLLTRKEERGGKQWTTGNIWSRFRQQYGYFEARMKIGGSSGLNNAFWLMTTNRSTDPVHFEIDITESHYPSRHTMTVHNWSGKHTATGKAWLSPAGLSVDFHIYAVEWTETTLRFFLDGEEVWQLPNKFCHDASPLRLSSAVGAWAGAITDALDGTRMEVDWVRVWEREKQAK